MTPAAARPRAGGGTSGSLSRARTADSLQAGVLDLELRLPRRPMPSGAGGCWGTGRVLLCGSGRLLGLSFEVAVAGDRVLGLGEAQGREGLAFCAVGDDPLVPPGVVQGVLSDSESGRWP